MAVIISICFKNSSKFQKVDLLLLLHHLCSQFTLCGLVCISKMLYFTAGNIYDGTNVIITAADNWPL
jgi:hypothetical protein